MLAVHRWWAGPPAVDHTPKSEFVAREAGLNRLEAAGLVVDHTLLAAEGWWADRKRILVVQPTLHRMHWSEARQSSVRHMWVAGVVEVHKGKGLAGRSADRNQAASQAAGRGAAANMSGSVDQVADQVSPAAGSGLDRKQL